MVLLNENNIKQYTLKNDVLDVETLAVESVLDLFQKQVTLNPDEKAIIFKEITWTYKQVDELSNRMANCLVKEFNVSNQEFIGLKLKRSDWTIIAMLAIMKTGSTYVPIDPDYPTERMKYIERDSQCRLVIDENQIKRFIYVKSEYSNLPTNQKPSLEDIAYVIYTSGSTGKPKGVPIRNYNLLNYLQWAEQFYKKNNEKFSFPFFTSLSFDLTQTSILLTLISGGTLYVFDGNDPRRNLKDILSNEYINAVKLTPSHVQVLPDEEKTKLPTFIVGGEALLSSHVEKIRLINSNAKIFNEYGPTETTIGCTSFRVKETIDNTKISIGKPIDNTSIYILGKENERLAIGEIGELCISGKGLSKGYLNRMDITKEKFIKKPWLKDSDEIIYKTGDLARVSDDGNLDYLGRIDDQVKIRGYRIELGEIIALIDDSGMVSQNVVLAQEDFMGNQVLVAYLVLLDNYNKYNLKEYLELFLPDYMIPSLFVEIDEIPLTSNGKVNKEALLNLELKFLLDRSEDLPRNETEEFILELWSQLLGFEEIGMHDNFFDLGGHSLLGINLISKINQTYDLNLGIELLFDYPTIALLAEAVVEANITTIQSQTNSILTKFNKGIKTPQLFCVSGVSGRSNSYFEFGNTFGKDYELYVFRSVGLYGKVPALEKVEEMAKVYIKELKEVNSTGPYILGGYSFGGRVVFEMAHQLKEQGLEVEKIILFDTWIHDKMPKDVFSHLESNEDWLWHWTHDYVRRHDKKIEFKVEELHGKSKKEQYEFIHLKLQELDIITDEMLMRGGAEVFINNLKCTYSEINKSKLDVPIIVLSTNPQNDYGWESVTNAKVNIIPVTGEHRTVLRKPHVQSLTIKLKRALNLV